VLSYCTLDDSPDIQQRHRNNWVNDLTEQELIRLCEKHKLSLVTVDRTVAKTESGGIRDEKVYSSFSN
jgi:hypothetical protein